MSSHALALGADEQDDRADRAGRAGRADRAGRAGRAGRPPDDTHDRPHDDLIRVVRAQTDAEREFSTFMADAAPRLARTAWLLCGDEHQADELVQQALTRTYLKWSTARERDPYAYARRTLANLRIDTWRRHRREVLVAPEDLPERPDGARTGDRHAERDQLVRALATLTVRQRRVVVLRHLAGLSEREVADDLGVSVGTVKSTASRGLAQLRSVLGAAADPTGTSAIGTSSTGTAPTDGSPA